MAELAELEEAFKKADDLALKGDRQAAADAKAFADEIFRLRSSSSDPQLRPHNPRLTEAGMLTTPEKPAPTRGEFLLNAAKKGVGDIAGLGDMALSAAGSVFPPMRLGAEALRRTVGSIVPQGRSAVDAAIGTQRDMKAPDPLTGLGGKMLEFGVAGAPFSAFAIANAAGKLPAIAAEVGSAIGGGAGSFIGGEVGQGFDRQIGSSVMQPLGEAIGGGIGGLAGLVTPTVIDKTRALIAPRISAQGREAAIRRIAGKELGGAIEANIDTPQNLALAAQTTDELNKIGARGFSPTLGQVTGAEGVISREMDIARSSPQDLGKYSQVARSNQAVVDKAKDIAFPQGGSVTRGAESVIRNTASALDKKLDDLSQAQELVAAQLNANPQQRVGEHLISLRDKAQNTARVARDLRLKEVYRIADDMKVSEDMTDVLDVVRSVAGKDESTFQNMPPVFAKVIREYGGKEGTATGRSVPPDLMEAAGITKKPVASFKEMHSLYRETNSQLAAAQRSGDSTQTYYLMRLKDALREKLAKYEQEGGGELAQKFKDFNNWFATKYAPAFYEGVGGRMVGKGRYGEIIRPEDLMSKVFTPSGIDDFSMVTSQLPDAAARAEAHNTLKDGIIGLFNEKAMKNGIIDVNSAKRFIRDNYETLSKVPDILGALQNPTKTAEMLADRASRLSEAQRKLDSTIVGKIAKADNPASVIADALSNDKKMMALVASAKGESNQRAVLRAIADGIPEAANRAGMDPLQFVLSKENSLRPMLSRLGPRHFDNLKTIAAAETISGRTVAPTHAETGKIGDTIEQLTGSTPRTIWSQTANTAAGRQSPVSGVLHLLSRFGIKTGEEQVKNVMREVIYKPELAQALAEAARQKVSPAASNKLRNHLISAGFRAASTTEQEQNQQ